MATISELITEVTDGDAQRAPREIAEAIYPRLGDDDKVGILTEYVANWQRNAARQLEAAAFAEFVNGTAKPATKRPDALAALFNTPFKLGENRTTSWGQATVEEHRIRIAFLEVMRNGIDRTISHHRRAIEVIEDAGVTCLQEVLDSSAIVSLLDAPAEVAIAS